MANWKKVVVSGSSPEFEDLVLSGIANAGEDTDKFLVLDSSNNVDFRTGAEVLTDIGASGGDVFNETFNSASISFSASLAAASASDALLATLQAALVLSGSGDDANIILESAGQGTLNLEINGVDASNVDTGLQTGDSPTFAGILVDGNAQVTGDLLVEGTTTSLNVATLQIEDRFILLNSSSGAPTVTNAQGGIVVQTSGSAVDFEAFGTAFIYEGSNNRWSIVPSASRDGIAGFNSTSSLATDLSTVDSEFVVTVSSSATAVGAGNVPGDPILGMSDATRVGLMFVDTSVTSLCGDNIYIYG